METKWLSNKLSYAEIKGLEAILKDIGVYKKIRDGEFLLVCGNVPFEIQEVGSGICVARYEPKPIKLTQRMGDEIVETFAPSRLIIYQNDHILTIPFWDNEVYILAEGGYYTITKRYYEIDILNHPERRGNPDKNRLMCYLEGTRCGEDYWIKIVPLGGFLKVTNENIFGVDGEVIYLQEEKHLTISSGETFEFLWIPFRSGTDDFREKDPAERLVEVIERPLFT